MADTTTSTTGLVLVNSPLDTESSLALWAFNRDGETVAMSTNTLPASAVRVVALNDECRVFK